MLKYVTVRIWVSFQIIFIKKDVFFSAKSGTVGGDKLLVLSAHFGKLELKISLVDTQSILAISESISGYFKSENICLIHNQPVSKVD